MFLNQEFEDAHNTEYVLHNDESVFNRDDVYFHKHSLFGKDSTRTVKASDFEYSLNRLIDNKVASSGRWVMNKVESFSAINDTIFNIKLNRISNWN